ncbi:MAG: ABC transporter permease [Gemmiger sp.]|nr:ABC transporter permease [Gemmiger sp.]
MLRLIKCEFWKLKRKRFVQLVVAAAFLFPIPLTYLCMHWPTIQAHCSTQAEVFDMMWQSVLGYGIQLLLPCILGIVAALLFFSERDNDTFKSLRTVPVSSTALVLAKVAMLFLFSTIFCVASTLVSVGCGLVAFEVQGIGYKLWMSIKMGVYITAGTLPLVAIVVFFSKSYIFSILLCVFYSVLNDVGTFVMGALPKAIVYLLPVPLTTLWGATDMQQHMAIGDADDLRAFAGLVPSEATVILILTGMAVISVAIMALLYKRRGE